MIGGGATRRRRRRVAILSAAALLALPAAAGAAPDAYVANSGSATVSQYTLGSTGLLSPKSTATVGVGTTPRSVAVSPDGASVYVTNAGNDNVSQFDVGADGSLVPKSIPTVATGAAPSAIAVSPDGTHAYVANSNAPSISQYDIGAGGVLTAMTPATVATGTGPIAIAVSPDGASAYVVNIDAGSVAQYDIGAGGALAPKSTATVATESLPYDIAITPDGANAYVSNQNSNSVSQYDIGTGGALTPKSTASVTTGTSTFPRGLTVGAGGADVYVALAGSPGRVAQFDITASGSLAPMSTPTVVAGTAPREVAVSPDGKSAYVANLNSADVSQYDITADGSLTAKSTPTVAAGTSPVAIVLRPDTVPPAATITAGPQGNAGSRNASFEFSAGEPGSTFECRLDGGSFAACSSPKAYTGLGFGTHEFAVTATDFSGNTGAADTRAWTIDAPSGDDDPPETKIDRAPRKKVKTRKRKARVTFEFSADEPSATFECSLDGKPYAACASPRSVKVKPGHHAFAVRASDAAGNADRTPAEHGFKVKRKRASRPNRVAARAPTLRSADSPQFAPCGDGYRNPPPKRYRFRIAGTVTSPARWVDGKESYLYEGVMQRKKCRGTSLEYWQTKGKVTQTFQNIAVGPPECEFTGQPPHYGIGNAPARTRPLKHYEVDVGFVWRGDEYQTSVINPQRDDPFAYGTVRCPRPPAANGATVPYTFEHVSTDLFTQKSEPKRVVKGRITNYLDINLYRHSFHWKLKAIG